MTIPPDHNAREQAINLADSYIVQAPAGSGKTELLIQRFLAALADCHALPEEVVAITFTRKAAGEMKQRVIDALLHAKHQPEPTSKHSQKTYYLSKKVLSKCAKLGWNILEKQHRICIMTIDALCRAINSQSASSIAAPHPAPKSLYLDVVHDFFNDLVLEKNPDLKDALLFFDHQPNWLKQLFCESLASRDQWLPLLFINQDIQAAAQQYIDNIWMSILEEYSSMQGYGLELLLKCYERCYAELEPKAKLKKLASIVLTNTGDLRKSPTIKQGLLSPSSTNCPQEKAQRKRDKIELIAYAQANLDFFQKVRLAPLIEEPALIAIIPKILRLLQQLVAYLKFHMQEQNTSDFIEQAQQTLQILANPIEWGNNEGLPRPGTLRHILVDEFQDTSIQQLELLKAILLHNDTAVSHSIFIVGDPMQSIYRFRQADVSLFYRVQTEGIRHIKPKALSLSCNFRSNAGLITSFNNIFPNIFPRQAIPKIAAVPYSRASTINSEPGKLDFSTFELDSAQFTQIAEICKANPDKHIGILVRSRMIAKLIMPYLQGLGVIEHGLQALINEPEVKDLLLLTNFLLQPYDNLTQANLLRSRIVGLELQELYDALENPSNQDLIQHLCSSNDLRKQKIGVILQQSIEFDLGLTLSGRTLKLWQALSPYSKLLANQNHVSWEYLNHLNTAEQISPLNPTPVLLELLQGAVPTETSSKIEIMTIHHAKGLEFDLVILPSLEKSTASRSGRILWWDQEDSGFLWLPNHPNQQAMSSAHKYIYELESKQGFQEQIRLLYVAMTRAKKELYCLATLTDCSPAKNSFLGLLFNWVDFKEKQINIIDTATENLIDNFVEMPRYQQVFPAQLVKTNAKAAQIRGITYHYWIHLFLEGLADIGAIAKQTKLYLLEQGFSEYEICHSIMELSNRWPELKNNKFWHWLLAADEIYSEHSIITNGKKYILDALVLKDGSYWIIDFKTQSDPSPNLLAQWYQQTEQYKNIFEHLSIKLMVYNPVCDTLWHEQGGKYVTGNSSIIG